MHAVSHLRSSRLCRSLALFAMLGLPAANAFAAPRQPAPQGNAQAAAAQAAIQIAQLVNASTVLSRDQASEVLPPSVFFHGKSSTLQGRNSAGVRLPNGQLVLAAVVDTSGYSSALQQSCQAYLITEVPLTIGGQRLPPGAYGFGFLAGNRLVLMDVGGNEILHAITSRDEFLSRPNPLQILAEGANGFRLYLGRSFIPFVPAVR